MAQAVVAACRVVAWLLANRREGTPGKRVGLHARLSLSWRETRHGGVGGDCRAGWRARLGAHGGLRRSISRSGGRKEEVQKNARGKGGGPADQKKSSMQIKAAGAGEYSG